MKVSIPDSVLSTELHDEGVLLNLETGEYFEIEHRFLRYDGRYRWHVSRAHAMRDAAGRITMWIGSNTDADKYLLSGGSLGCGTAASAASHRGSVAGAAAEIMGLVGIMMLPLSVIMMQRYLRRKKKA